MARSSTDFAGLFAVAAALIMSWCCGDVNAAEAAAAKPAPASADADLAKLKQLSDAWDKAIWEKNRKAVADNMGEDFRIIDGGATIADKQQFIADIMDPKLTIDPYTVEDFNIRLYGDMALLAGRTRMTGKNDGRPFVSNYRYIDIYARRRGTWQIVHVQITRIPAPSN